MMEKPTDVVGHKTFSDGQGGFRHEPLTREEADALHARIEAAKVERERLMPDEKAALRIMTDAYHRLEELGWKSASYCPKDGTQFDAIEAGSSGIHRCHYEGEWPEGGWWISAHNDLWPSRPILFRKLEKK